jgi:large subunit ribosomal protein L20
MARASYSVSRHRRKKRILKEAKGYWGGRRKLIRTAMEVVRRGHACAFRDRRRRKRDFRRLWITRISAAVRQRGLSYSRFMNGLAKANVAVNRKILSELAVHDPGAFDQLVEKAKQYLTA